MPPPWVCFLVAVVSAAFGVTGRRGVWATTVYVKLRITGLEDVVVVPVVELDVVEAPEPLDPADEPELDDEVVEELEEPEEPPLDVDEPLDPAAPALELDDEPAFLVVLELEPLVPVPVVPLVPDAAPWALEPPAAEPPWPVVLPVVPRPVPVVAPAPPTSPIRASTWHRTVALFALSIVPFSITTISTSPEPISTKCNGACAFPNKFAGR
jgi:hypothetical protein